MFTMTNYLGVYGAINPAQLHVSINYLYKNTYDTGSESVQEI